MLQNTRGFIFNVSRYSDSSGIVKIFTEEEGLRSFVVKSLYSRTSRLRAALFGHLSLLDLTFDYKPGRTLQYIKEASLNKSYFEIGNNILRSSVLLFINEILLKTVREEEANPVLFNFIEETLDSLNDNEVPVAAFHLLFMIRLADHLGFGTVHSLSGEGEHFDLLSGTQEVKEPPHSYFISSKPLELLKSISVMDYSDLKSLDSNRIVRLDLMKKLIDFYKIHVPEMTEIKSAGILHEIMS
ncbi:MAG TPA: DNA repair protein RecO [Lentimicrobium sp.]|nr:DNA repair protein RecO [Lentimicrobium sp.]